MSDSFPYTRVDTLKGKSTGSIVVASRFGETEIIRDLPAVSGDPSPMKRDPKAVHQAFCGVVHVTCGAEDWEPTREELEEVSNLFLAAFDAQREGGFGIITTRSGVESQVLCASTVAVIQKTEEEMTAQSSSSSS